MNCLSKLIRKYNAPYQSRTVQDVASYQRLHQYNTVVLVVNTEKQSSND